MRYNRKQFLRLSSGLACGALIAQTGCTLFQPVSKTNQLKDFGLQLYTLRDTFETDPLGTIKQLAGAGYKFLEGYERSKGIFWGSKNTDFKKFVEDLGMSFVASHCDTEKDFEKKADEAAAVGMKYLISAWEGPGRSIEWYKQFAEKLNGWGNICKKSGISFAFHNHSYSFEKRNGLFPQDILLQYTDEALVDFELDIYWAAVAGENAAEWMARYPNRFKLGHIKDLNKNPGNDNDKNSVNLGDGSIDIPNTIKSGVENGMKYFFVEQEYCPNGTPLQTVFKNARYMKQLKF